MIKAIETRYAGCRFRSRLEARWAVFLDHATVDVWEYEPEGFQLPSGMYLPDFRLTPEQTETPDFIQKLMISALGQKNPLNTSWLEVKGQKANTRERQLARELSEQARNVVCLLEGDVPRCPTATVGPISFMSAPAWNTQEQKWDNAVWIMGGTIRIQEALTVARSARFEHGERG